MRFEIFDNRRRYPRLKMNLPVTLVTPAQRIVRGFVSNISPDGIQLRYKAYAADGVQLEISSVQVVETYTYNLQFDLALVESVAHVNINAHPVYQQVVKEGEVVCGMFFSEEDLAENKKISDFLFYQLQASFNEFEYVQQEDKTTDEEPVTKVHRTVIENTRPLMDSDIVKSISEEVDELVLQMNYPKTYLEPVKLLLFRILTSLKVIQELIRHSDERIRNLEHKLSRRG